MPQIFDPIRKKYVALTPEEGVRQQTISLLINQCHYPITRLSTESRIRVGKTTKRYDIVILDEKLQPFMLVECKAPNVNIDENTLSQALAYNTTLKAKYIFLTNGKINLLFRITAHGVKQQHRMPVSKKL